MKTKTPKKPAPKTRKRKADDPAQYERFRQMARELETDESPEAFDRVFETLVPPRRPKNIK
jgi:hypothetical protein